MLASDFAAPDRLQPTGTGAHLDGALVQRQSTMTYWFRWRDHTFDIRVIRRLLRLPQQQDDVDLWFVNPAYRRDPEAALAVKVGQLRDALRAAGQPFAAVLRQHDRQAGA